MIDIAAIVLPQPDSPTMPTVSPASTSKLSPSTACTMLWRSLIWVRRSTTSSSLVIDYFSWSLTSKASCKASPMKLKATTVRTMTISAG